MKRLILSILPLLVGCALSAQTYHDGVWYSIYDDATHTMNTQGDYETGGVFAPTTGTLNVKWRYEWVDWFGAFAKIDTEVLTSADNGDNTTKVGKLAENTGKNSNTTESFSVGQDINWIKFNRTGLPTHKVHVYHIDIPLAKHILLASGDYGTATASYDFGEQDALSISEPYMVNLRSFLSAGDITVTSSDPEIFHLGSAEATEPIVYAVGANACASANGTADAASGASLGKIDNYAFPVYFTPKEGVAYSSVITITDGVSTATITLSGTGRKLDQSITWDQEKTTILSNETIAPATASSSLEVTYTFSPEGIVTFADGVFSILKDGEVTITAAQSGNEIYKAAESVVKTFTIFPAVTYNTYEASVCEGEAYIDAHFGVLTEEGLYTDTIPNAFGGDSIISLSLYIHPLFASEETSSHYLGLAGEWQGIDLSLFPLGDTTLVAAYSSAYGCDSVYTLHLSVIPRPTTYGNDTLLVCAGETVEYNGKTYKRSTQEEVVLPGANIYGGDSIVSLVVTVLPAMRVKSSLTITEGTEEVWQDIDLSLFPAGDTTLTVTYPTIHGCDSIYTLQLTVNPVQQTTTALDNADAVGDKPYKFFRNGQMYIRKNGQVYNLQGIKIEEE